MSAETRDRLARWVAAYRQLMLGGLALEAHTACVDKFAKDGEHPYVTPNDVEALLLAVAAVETLCDQWEREATERGPEDTLYATGVVAMLRSALGGAA